MHSARADWRSEAAMSEKAVSLPSRGGGVPCPSAQPRSRARWREPVAVAGAVPWRRARVTAAALPRRRGKRGRAQELLVQSQGVCQGQQSQGLLFGTQFLNKTGTLSSEVMLLFHKASSVSRFQYGCILYMGVSACDPYVSIYMIDVGIT